MTPVKALAFSLFVFGAPYIAQAQPAAKKSDAPHNVILFIADGLRAVMVDKDTAPTMTEIRDGGVNFRNSHSVFPTLTTANASVFATGHLLGDTGDWANTLYSGFPVSKALDTVTPFVENDAVLGELDQHFGDYLDEQTVLSAARAAGFSTAAVGKLGPALIQDHTARDGEATIVIDDATGNNGVNDGPRRGIPLSQPVIDAMNAAGLLLTAPATDIPNREQQDYFTDAFTKVVLPMFKTRGKPFYAVFWSRDPDGTQHNQTDGKGKLLPGINGLSSLMAIHNADDDLARIRDTLKAQGLDQTTDIIVASDHGFSTIYKESVTSTATKMLFTDSPIGLLPNGFLALDLARALKLPLFDPDNSSVKIGDGMHPKRGNGLLGADPAHTEVIVAANGGADLIYLPGGDVRGTAVKIVAALLAQDYTSGIFVRDDLGPIPGTLPLSAIGLKGSAVTPAPAIVVNFKSFALGCDVPLKCTAEIADAQYGQGQGMHGSFSRADTYNFQAAIGPDFKHGFVDPAPSSNADIGQTIAHILGLKLKGDGKQVGRVLSEALSGGTTPAVKSETLRSQPAANGLTTVVNMQSVGGYHYFDAAGFANRTVGLVP
jgi:arylsulfatase A-like enzyme